MRELTEVEEEVRDDNRGQPAIQMNLANATDEKGLFTVLRMQRQM